MGGGREGWRQKVLTGWRKAQPRSSPLRCGRSLGGSRAPPLAGGGCPLLGSFAGGPVIPRPPTARGSHGSGLLRSTGSRWNSCSCPRGWRLPTGQTISPPRLGVRIVLRGAGAEGAEGPRMLGATKNKGKARRLQRGGGLGTGGTTGRAAASLRGLLKTAFELFLAPPSPLALVALRAPLERGKQKT